MKLLARGTRAVPRRLLPHYGNVVLDLVRQEPGPSGAVIQGLFFGRIAPHRSERHTFQTPALVLGHHRDPVHPFSDAGMLAKELPNARLLEADSLVELRLQPERLTDEIAAFLDEVWGTPRAVANARRRNALARTDLRESAAAAKAPRQKRAGEKQGCQDAPKRPQRRNARRRNAPPLDERAEDLQKALLNSRCSHGYPSLFRRKQFQFVHAHMGGRDLI